MNQENEGALQDYTDGNISAERLAERLGVNFYVLHSTLRRGCQLFEPKPDESRLLTDDEIQKASGQEALDYWAGDADYDKICPRVAQAQLAKDIKWEALKKQEGIE